MESIKKRKPNWTDLEHEILVQLVSENLEAVRAKFSPTVTSHTKAMLWAKITERINATSDIKREDADVKKKWQDLQCMVKKKAAEEQREKKKTGGGPVISRLKPWEMMIRDSLPTAAVTGLPGGVDTAEVVFDVDNINYFPALPDYEGAAAKLELPNMSEVVVAVDGEEVEEREHDREKFHKSSKKLKTKHTEQKLSFEEELLLVEKKKEEYRKEKLALLKRQTIALEQINDSLKTGGFLTL